jgi:TfoX/Sxy family transcriptional regulator of competence genes
MPYDEDAAIALRQALDAVMPTPGLEVVEKKMFGGLALMVGGHMCVGIIEDRVVARIGPDAYTAAIGEPDTGPMDFTGRPMKGWLYLMPPIVADPQRLQAWTRKAVAFVESLGPPKPKKARKSATRRTK